MLKVVCNKSASRAAFKSINQHVSKVKKGVNRGFNDSKSDIEQEIEDLMKDKKHGKVYTVRVSKSGRKLKRGRLHTASSRNEPFAWLSGETFRSMGMSVTAMRMRIGFRTIWGARWEKTQRTVISKAVSNQEKNIKKNILNNIKKSIYSQKGAL